MSASVGKIAPATRPSPSPGVPKNPAAPFLLWPVSRREFYRTIWIAMVPVLAWGIFIFGIRALEMLIVSVLAVTGMHILLKRILRWRRGQALVYPHSLVCALVLVALAHPMWPNWIVVAMALLIPVVLAVLGGPGKEPVHLAVVMAFVLQLVVVPLLPRLNTYAGGPDAILAKDRLFVGDIRDQRAGSIDPWPSSLVLGGNDAVRERPPAVVAAETFDAISREMEKQWLEEGETAATLPAKEEGGIRQAVDRAFAFDLPGMDLQMIGAVPGRIGMVSLIGVIVAGLYLAYRFILRPGSVTIFVAAFIAGTFLLAFWPSAAVHVGFRGLWMVIRTFRGEVGTLLAYLLLNSDLGFAAVFILALPGTEPLTAHGRRVFLVVAGLLGAALHRAEPAIPAATLALCVFMPFVPMFDRFFAKRSWLNARP